MTGKVNGILWNTCCLIVCVLVPPSAVCLAVGPPNVLDLPRIMQQQTADNQRGVELLRAGEYENAKLVFKQSVMRVPHDTLARYNLACAYALLDQPEDAVENLQAALKLGFRNRQQLEKDSDLDSLRELREFEQLLVDCSQPPPTKPFGWRYSLTIPQSQSGKLLIDSHCMLWDASSKAIQVVVDVNQAGKERLACGIDGQIGESLLKWFSEGSAAGNVGDIYDNQDRAHSPLDLKMFPQMTATTYAAEVQQRQLDNGAQRTFLYVGRQAVLDQAVLGHNAQPQGNVSANIKGSTSAGAPRTPTRLETITDASDGSKQLASSDGVNARPPAKDGLHRVVVLGNSSTALTGSPFWRSMPRLALTSPGGAEVLVQHYLNNHLYVYPEHRDHDPGHDEQAGWGDVFFANTPFYIVSQGSSGTDQPFLQALAATLAALPPETKKKLREKGLISPTLQMIFRRCNRSIQSDDDYLTGLAHPTVFEGSQIDMERMVAMAHALKPTEIPPLAIATVLREDMGNPSVDYFDSVQSEAIINSPFAICRACNSTKYWREMVVTSRASVDANQAPLTFQWVVLRGDPQRVVIEPIEGDPMARHLRIGYHPRFAVQSGSTVESNRVDIGLFAHNGHCYSAPAIISFYFPDNEVRTYDDRQRILSVDYSAGRKNYVDPSLIAERNWRDDYHYGSNGLLRGWTRTRGEEREQFDATGRLLPQGDKPGEESTPIKVTYQRLKYPDGRPFIRQSARTK